VLTAKNLRYLTKNGEKNSGQNYSDDCDILWAEGPAIHQALGNAQGIRRQALRYDGPIGQSFFEVNGWPFGPMRKIAASRSPGRCPGLGELLPRWGKSVKTTWLRTKIRYKIVSRKAKFLVDGLGGARARFDQKDKVSLFLPKSPQPNPLPAGEGTLIFLFTKLILVDSRPG
jgi:hypothetical protein